MELVMLGTGGAFTRLRSNYHNNALIEIGDRHYLLDCSLHALEALADDHDLSPLDLDGVLVTHLHGDHVSGLEELGFRTLFSNADRPDLYCHPHLVPSRLDSPPADLDLDLWDNCLRGGMAKLRASDGTAREADLETYFELHLRESFHLQADGETVELSWVPTDHAPGMPSFGLQIEAEGAGSLLYTGDARPLEQSRYEDADTILHDCMLLPSFPGTLHTHLDELLELPPSLQARIHIMHYGEVDEAVGKAAGTPLQVARPGSRFEV